VCRASCKAPTVARRSASGFPPATPATLLALRDRLRPSRTSDFSCKRPARSKKRIRGTGGRLGELVYLQKRDVNQSDGRWIIDLTKHILIDDDIDDVAGASKITPTKEIEAPRKTKNARSKRFVALHESLELLGFLEWVDNRDQGFLFPMLHRAEHVSNAASKRFMRLFKEAGIHEPITDVFHSLRHSYRDLMADNDIAEATAEKQLAHTPSTQGGATEVLFCVRKKSSDWKKWNCRRD
jgi:integrase